MGKLFNRKENHKRQIWIPCYWILFTVSIALSCGSNNNKDKHIGNQDMKIEVHKLPVTDSTTVVEGRIQILEQELDIAALEDLAARPLSAIFSSDQQLKGLFWGARLDSPDEIKVKLLQVKKEQIVVELDYLNYKGPLLKNVLSQALVVFELGSFHPGRYTLQVIVSNYEFSKYNQPSPEQFLNKDTYSFDFRIE